MITRQYVSLALSLLALGLIILGTAFWGRAYYRSAQVYRSPLRGLDLPAQPPLTQSQPPQIVIVLISGLGYDSAQSLDMPVLAQLRQAGANMAMESAPPSYSQTAWATLITGAPPETNDAPPLDLPADSLHPLAVDTIFARAHSAQLPVALLGPAEWRRLIPPNQLDYTFFANQPGPEADAAIMEVALPTLQRDEIKLALIHFTQVDLAGQNGTQSEAYRQAAATVDAYLRQISRVLDFNRVVLVVLADHGHVPDGGHGGDEAEVIWQPLVLMGQNIVPGSYSDVRQIDLAPTLTTLLGLAPPTANQGRILFELLHLAERDQAAAQLALAQQRLVLAEAYLSALSGSSAPLPEVISADLVKAQAAQAGDNLSGALELARLTRQEADTLMLNTRNGYIALERWIRLVIVLVVMALTLTLLWRRRGLHAGAIILAALFTIGLYHVLYQLQGHAYSVSALRSFSDWPLDIARRTAVSLLAGGGLMLIFLMMTREEHWLTLLNAGYGFGLLVTVLFSLPLLWAFWQNGLVIDWYLPAMLPAFWQMTGLLEVMIAAILGILLPWPIMILSLFVSLTHRRLDESRARSRSDTLPGLHL